MNLLEKKVCFSIIWLLSFIGGLPGADRVDFLPVQNIQVGTGTHYLIVVGDFNEDGHQDLAVTDSSNAVFVLLGHGDGTFGEAKSFGVGHTPISIAVGDFDGDRHQDLAVANLASNYVSILFGKGDGTFEPARSIGVPGNAPRSITVADFNGDKIDDLAVAYVDSNDVSTLISNGDGTFRPGGRVRVVDSPYFIVVGDFNGDGLADLATSGNGLSILIGDGTGGVSLRQAFEIIGAVSVADFNRDGIPDLAVTDDVANAVVLLLGKGDGTFEPAYTLPLGAATGAVVLGDCNCLTITVGDFDGDQLLDLAVSTYTLNTVLVSVGNGDATFEPPQSFPVGRYPFAVVVGDFNGDGRPDIVTPNEISIDHNISILINNTPWPTP